ncbi:MAG: hypothetical protein JWQ17_7016 [Tardiphaga sp.]|jgi:hypothetical protein|nr:hypothetical protein [Tardiphaga sp.]
MSQPGSDYPYGSSSLRPQWRDRWARGLAALVLSCMGISLFAHLSVWPVDRIALLIVLPALLGITLAFAPDPPALVSRLAKRLTVAGCAVGPFAGPWLAPMILAVPALLALSVAIGSLWDLRRG